MGLEIAAHGWKHQAETNKTLYHKIHSMILSENCAEHLSRDRQSILNIMQTSYEWFKTNGLGTTKLYVPPAWALGCVTIRDLKQLEFSLYECTTGLIINQKYLKLLTLYT